MGLYTLGIHLYQGILRLAALRNRKARLMLDGRKQTLSAIRAVRKDGEKWLWLHAASLGEFEQGRPMLERLRSEKPEWKIALTFYSPSGYEIRKNWQGADVVAYLPADTPRAMNSFLDALRPDMAVIVKYEFWRNMLVQLKKRLISTYLISAIFRPDQLFFKPWGGSHANMLRCFTHLYVQDKQSRKLLEKIGVKNVSVAGDTRFDRVTDIKNAAKEIPELESFTQGGARLTMIFGSSWPGDEDVYFPQLRKSAGQIKAVIAPHEFDAARLEAMRTKLTPLRVVLLSEVKEGKASAADADVLIIDCFGLLSSAYRYGHIAYIGGGFGAGIHNINEAAVYGIPVIFGPRYDKFLEAKEIIKEGGGYSVASADEFSALMEGRGRKKGLLDPAVRKAAGEKADAYIRSKLGATDIIYGDIFG